MVGAANDIERINIMDEELIVRAQRREYSEEVDFLIYTRAADGGRNVIGLLESTHIPKDMLASSPTFSLKVNQAQELLNNLWAQGLRPSDPVDSTGALAATKKHLADMRSLVAKCMKISL